MEKVADYTSSESSSPDKEDDIGAALTTVGYLGSALSPEPVCALPIEGCVGSSSWSHLKSHFVGMGFSTTMVDKAIQENGEEDADLLLETLLTYSAVEKFSSEISDGRIGPVKEEFPSTECTSSSSDWEIEDTDTSANDNRSTKTVLLMMKFTEEEVDFAISTLGFDAPLPELVDHILTAQTFGIAGGKDQNESISGSDGKDEENAAESLFGMMDKTLCLLDMGLTEDEISSALDKFGSEATVRELADLIIANRIATQSCNDVVKEFSRDNLQANKDKLKGKNCSRDQNDTSLQGLTMKAYKKRGLYKIQRGLTKASSSNPLLKKIKKENHPLDDTNVIFSTHGLEARMFEPEMPDQPIPNSLRELHESSEEPVRSELPRPHMLKHCKVEAESENPSIPDSYKELHGSVETKLARSEVPIHSMPKPSGELNRSTSGSTYFFYGNVADVPGEDWEKISRFLFGIEPEFADTQFFSAFIRKEGYVHNLPKGNRFRVEPPAPMTVQDALPHTKDWWPSWDTRKKLSCITSDTGTAQLCERLGKIVIDSQGILSYEQKNNILHNCKTQNLIWVGPNELSPIKPNEVENILGYPRFHTEVGSYDSARKLRVLKDCFQTDTLSYHLSTLKGIFPDGLSILSLFTGIGGAEVALHRLGIHLKLVVSAEASESNQAILRNWWSRTEQTGTLIQIEHIAKLTSQKIENLMKEFGGFDLVIGRNPVTDVSGGLKVALDDFDGIDFQNFFEFIRVVNFVRGLAGRNR